MTDRHAADDRPERTTTAEPEEVREWADRRDAVPASREGEDDDRPDHRFFPSGEVEEGYRECDIDEFLEWFAANNRSFVYAGAGDADLGDNEVVAGDEAPPDTGSTAGPDEPSTGPETATPGPHESAPAATSPDETASATDQHLTGDDRGKTVVDDDGEEVGLVSHVESQVAYVEPDPGVLDKLEAMIGLGGPGQDESEFPITDDQILQIDDDRVVIDPAADPDLEVAGTGEPLREGDAGESGSPDDAGDGRR